MWGGGEGTSLHHRSSKTSPPIPAVPTNTQHHRLPPASGPAPNVLAAGSSARLNELLDLVRAEFESAGVEGSQWKVQRDEYEGKSEFWVRRGGAERGGRGRWRELGSGWGGRRRVQGEGKLDWMVVEYTRARVREEPGETRHGHEY